jgi:DNA-binding transcriptional MerR regulator/methylmalonyl-CoA mutase cobalamin-binding subunit
MHANGTEPRHPINYVAKRSGLTTHAIRVWERRYGAVTPVRSGKNRRLYSDDDIERLRLLKTITAAGHSIGQIARLTDEDLRALAAQCAPEQGTFNGNVISRDSTMTPETALERCRHAVTTMDDDALETVLREATVSLAQMALLEDVIAPLMRWVGDEWHAGRLRVAHEHLASAVVETILTQFRSSFPDSGPGPIIVIATPPGHQHEIGAHLAACVAAMEGWCDRYFGANLPIPEVAGVARQANARAVGLSIAYVGNEAETAREIRDLIRLLPSDVDVILGGAAAERFCKALEKTGARCVSTLPEFRDILRELAAGSQAS